MGIDYGLGKTNIDPETNLRYGVISQYNVMQAWSDSFELYYPCDDCEVSEEEKEGGECEFCELEEYVVDDGEYLIVECLESDLMILKSPYFTYGNYCSPCVPGAVNLDQTGNDDKAYCLGHDWFEEEKAPYIVYRVSDGKRVHVWRYMITYRDGPELKEYHAIIYGIGIEEASQELKKVVPQWIRDRFYSSHISRDD